MISRVYQYVQHGWSNSVDVGAELKPYLMKRSELSTEAGCILWGSRIVVPPQGQRRVLQELHATHPGVIKMKTLARSYVWWPHLDNDIESAVKECSTCQAIRRPDPAAPLHPWEWPSSAWDRVHVD